MEGSTAIVLAGGFGTRLKSVIDGIPKPMAEINGKPFLHYLLFQLTKFQIKNVILSVGYLHESILNYFDNKFFDLNIYYSVESKPLGTGGAIDKATTDFNLNEPVLILNGDSFFDINIDELFIFHKEKKSDLTLALKEMKNFDRYGSVEIDEDNRITGFFEKSFKDVGLINCGVYILNPSILNNYQIEGKFSFEKEFMQKHPEKHNFYGKKGDGYFIDIGIPEDYHRAKEYFFG